MGSDQLSSDVRDRLQERREGQTPSGTLVASADEAYVGDTITLRGLNLPAEAELDVVWQTVEGKWGVLQANEVVGPQYRPREERVLTVTTDADGKFEREWKIPEDYGGEHTIELRQSADDETALAETTIAITPWFELDRTEAPLGEFFTITGYGIGPNVLENNYQVAWDNGTAGFMTGVMNRGTATAQIRAAGPVGNHELQVWRNYRGVPFLQNNTQSPFGEVAGGRQYAWSVEVTEPETPPETMWIDSLFDEAPLSTHLPDPDRETAAELEVTPQSGQPGSDIVITGRNFPAGETVDLVWHTHEGHRVKDIPISPEPQPGVLPTVEADDEGRFQLEVTAPRDRGATRPITAEIGGESVAVAGFMLQPEITSMSPTSGPSGTEIEIELSGIGWPIYENAYYFLYDNKPLGYICGLEAKINKTVLRAAGEPGYHFIDVYPSLFDVRDDEPDFELKPHLSYIDNHPVRPLPGLHMAFEITE
ncbi:hypothetical protein GJ629_11450 [Halapricum sp. CBA1109]|uniref:hypothetical protein n=1 Tax=Halapricum sp. CBA1109 TaxID=2668068 RepID=UPI0012FB0724|nr:hypothetical protein [Halapricum sp. CBA1109]MUV90442.1 hypothetical protein [Halapricum sp. CBA1109]